MRRGWIVTIATLLVVVGCDRAGVKGYKTLDGFALGTTYHIVMECQDTVGFGQELEQLIEAANSSMSLYDPNSLLNRLNRGETDSLDRHIERCIEIAHRVSEMSAGAYDITIKPLTQAWGFGASEQPDRKPNVDSLMQYVGYQKIEIRSGRLIKHVKGVEIDLNSVAKGYVVDMVAELIEKRGVESYLVEIGGEVMCRGSNPKGKKWQVGIDKPLDGNNIPGRYQQQVVEVTDRGLATSGNYRRFYIDQQGDRVVHTIDARTGESRPTDILSVTVVAQSAAQADAMATMVMVLGMEATMELLKREPDIMCYIVYRVAKEQVGEQAEGSGVEGQVELELAEHRVYITPNLESSVVR